MIHRWVANWDRHKSRTEKCGHCQGTGIHTLDGFCWFCNGTGKKLSAKRQKPLFSNGIEYIEFLEKNCLKCSHFVHPEEVTDEQSACEIENRIALCGIDPNVIPPLEWLDENEFMHRYDCRKKSGNEPKEDQA